MNLTTYPLHVQSPVMGINHALTMVGVTVCGFRRCVRFSWGWGFKIFQDLCPLVIGKNSFNVPGHLSENL